MTDKELNAIIRQPRPVVHELYQTQYGLFAHYILGGFYKSMEPARMRVLLDKMLDGDHKYSAAQKDKIREIRKMIG